MDAQPWLKVWVAGVVLIAVIACCCHVNPEPEPIRHDYLTVFRTEIKKSPTMTTVITGDFATTATGYNKSDLSIIRGMIREYHDFPSNAPIVIMNVIRLDD